MCGYIQITTLTIFMGLFSMATRIIALFFFYNLEINDKINLILPSCLMGAYSFSVFTTVYGILKSKPFFLIPFLILEISNFLTHSTIFIYSILNLKFYNFLFKILLKEGNNDTLLFYIYVITSIFILFFELYIINIIVYCYYYLLTINIVPKNVIIDPPPPYSSIVS